MKTQKLTITIQTVFNEIGKKDRAICHKKVNALAESLKRGKELVK